MGFPWGKLASGARLKRVIKIVLFTITVNTLSPD
jgi:hypothetical protein